MVIKNIPEFLNTLQKDKKIFALKKKLEATDYKAIKYAEGLYTEEEYLPTKTQREKLRSKIRELEEDN